jgi:hypothetical protein
VSKNVKFVALKTLLIINLILPLWFFSQGYLPVGGRANSMANATVALSDAWSFHHNPGALAKLDKLSIGVSYENRFLIKELQSQGFVYIQPVKSGVISFGAQSYGYSDFRTFRGGLGYSMKLTEKFMAGVQLNYQNLRLTDFYGSRQSVTAEFGLLCLITENWHVGMSIFNIGRAKLSSYQDDRFSTVMRLGTSFAFSDKLILAAETEKHIDYPLRVKSGLDYALAKHFYLRAGVATQPIELTFGFGYRMKSVLLDFGSAYHQLLGFSPHFGLTYTRSK